MDDMFNLGNIVAQLSTTAQQRTEGLNQQANTLATDTAELEKLLTGNTQAAQALIAEKTALAGTKATLDVHNQQLAERAQAIVGLNPDDLNNDFVKSVAAYNIAEDKRKAARAEYDQAASVGMLDNPLVWFFNQLELPTLAAKNNAAVAERDSATRDIQARTTMLSQVKNSVIANTADAAKRYNLQLAELSAKEANLKLAEEEIKNRSAIASRKMQEFTLRDKALDVQWDTASKILTVEDAALRRQQARTQADLLNETRQMQLNDKKEQEAVEANMNLNLQRFSQFIGRVTPITVKELKTLPKKDAEIYWKIASTGELGATMQDALTTVLRTPGAVETIRMENPLVARTIQSLDKGIEGYTNAYIADYKRKNGNKDPKAAAALEAGVDLYTQELINSANAPNFAKPLNHESWDRTWNPYRADHKLIGELVDQGNAKFLADNVVVKTAKTIQQSLPSTADGFTGENETQMLRAIGEQVKSGAIDPKTAAAQVVQYYNAARVIGLDQTQYSLFKIPPAKRYLVTLPAAGLFGKPITADLLNPASVETMFTTMKVTGLSGDTAGLMASSLLMLNPTMKIMGGEQGQQRLQKNISTTFGDIGSFLLKDRSEGQ